MNVEAMNSYPWFPCYPSDLIGDTTHLNNHDFGAYWRLLCWYYIKGPPPNDDESLRQIMRVDKAEWQRTRGNVLAFFQLNGDGSWHQKRADEVIRERDEYNRMAREKSLKGVEAKRAKGLLPPKPQVEPGVSPQVHPGVETGVVPGDVSQVEHNHIRTSNIVHSTKTKFGTEGSSEKRNDDWNGKTLNEKVSFVLGAGEIAKRQDWIRRTTLHPGRMEEIVNIMHAEIMEGHIIKNRGAYAETLWKKQQSKKMV